MDDREARFDEVITQVWDPLQRYLGRRLPAHQVDDVLSETLLVIWRRLDDVPLDAALPWSYAVARRCLANHRRSDSRRLALVRRLEHEPPPGDPVDVELDHALAQLGDADRELLHLWAWEQLEPREMAVVLGLTPNAVSLRLTRAKKKLEKELVRQNPALAGHIRDVSTKEHRE